MKKNMKQKNRREKEEAAQRKAEEEAALRRRREEDAAARKQKEKEEATRRKKEEEAAAVAAMEREAGRVSSNVAKFDAAAIAPKYGKWENSSKISIGEEENLETLPTNWRHNVWSEIALK